MNEKTFRLILKRIKNYQRNRAKYLEREGYDDYSPYDVDIHCKECSFFDELRNINNLYMVVSSLHNIPDEELLDIYSKYNFDYHSSYELDLKTIDTKQFADDVKLLIDYLDANNDCFDEDGWRGRMGDWGWKK